MEQMNYKELDHRIHSFLNRKFAELATLERMPKAHAWERRNPNTRNRIGQLGDIEE